MPSKLLVTGATGFVGAALVQRALADGWTVRAAVRHAVEPDGPRDMDVVPIGELGPDTTWAQALKGIDVVVHCAARVHVMRETALDPAAEFQRINESATLNLARQAVLAGVRRFVFLSTVHVNGEATLDRAFTSEDSVAPLSAYALSKHRAELGLKAIADASAMARVVIRPPLVYGPGVRGNFATIMHWLCRGWPLPFAAIHNRRSLIGLDNLVDLILRCAQHPGAADQTFLVSDGNDLSTTDLLRRLGRALGRPARLFAIPAPLLRAGAQLLGRPDIAQRICGSLQVDISRTQRILDWAPPFSVDEGLTKTAKFFLREARH